MSNLIDYGYDRAPEPEHRRRRWSLPVVCAVVIATYALIAVAGLALLHVRMDHAPGFRLSRPETPSPAAHTVVPRR